MLKELKIEDLGNGIAISPQGEEGDKETSLQEISLLLQKAQLFVMNEIAGNSRIIRPGRPH